MDTREEQTKKAVDALSDLVNNFNFDQKLFNEEFSREHRTLQQSMFRAFLKLILHIASDEYQTDGRNEQTKKTAQMILNGLAAEYAKRDATNYGDESPERIEKYTQEYLKDPQLLTHITCI